MKAIRLFPFKAIAIALLISMGLSSCGTSRVVPISGRKQRVSSAYNDGQMLALGEQYYAQYMSEAKVSSNATQTAMVRRVGQRLAAAVEGYLSQNGYADEVPYYNWEFNLVADNQVNAFCMPGGKIVVYEGILPVTQDEASLAVVLGHEIAHAVGKHSAEQNSKQQWQQIGAMIGAVGMQAAGIQDDITNIAMQGASTVLGIANLSYSRKHELEADYIGLILAAMAGYDPRVAPAFWQRMSEVSGGSGGSDFFSTHPSDDKRIAQLEELMPTAILVYQNASGTAAAAPAATSGSKGSTTTATTVNGNIKTLNFNDLKKRNF